MRRGIKKSANHTYLVLEEMKLYEEDYQLLMLEANPIPGILSVKGRGVDEKSRYYYDIAGKAQMKSVFQKEKLRREEVILFLTQLQKVMGELYNYMLNPDCLILKPNYIFWGNKEFSFCYYVLNQMDLAAAFHRFTEYLVSQVDYQDKDAIYLVYELHKRSMEDNYNVRELLETVLSHNEHPAEYTPQISDSEEIYEAAETAERVFSAEAQQRDNGRPKSIRNYIKCLPFQQKKSKWGEWDELSIP